MIKNKLIPLLIIVIIISQIFFPSIVHASLWDSAREESGSAPPPPTPPDQPIIPPTTPSNPGNTDDTEDEDVVEIETHTCYTTISGNVKEDMGYTIGSSGKDNGKNYKSISNVLVNLYNSSGELVASQRTDGSGGYSFKPGAGTYHTEIWYGDLSGISTSANNGTVQNVLKYNGHDYLTVSVPSSGTHTSSSNYIDVEKLEIKNSGKGALQIYLGIDCSYSMRKRTDGKNRLDLVVDSAKKLCNYLLGLNENIYIGLIFFSGTNYRAVSLTKNENLLIAALSDIQSNNWYTANTDILGALDKAYNSYYNNEEDSNRYFILLSDGFPTSDGSTKTYNTDSNEEINRKLPIISGNTKKRLNKLTEEQGVTTICLFTKSTDEQENELIEKTFKSDSKKFEILEDSDYALKVVIEELKDFISEEAQKERKHYTSSSSSTFETLKGYEDAERRKEVDELFKDDNNILSYKNTIMFDQIENYDGSSITSKQIAKTLSDKTKMRVAGGSNYVITTLPDPSEKEIKDESGKVIKKIIYQEASYGNQDFVLSKFPQFSLSTQISATRLMISLDNGQVICNQTRKASADIDDFILQYIDNELIYNSKILVQYTINIKNNSSIQCDHLKLLIQVPDGFSYAYNTSSTKSVRLSDLADNNLIAQEVIDGSDKKSAFEITLDNGGKGENGFYIAPGGNYEIKVQLRTTATGFDKSLENLDNISAEILEYTDQTNRRMTKIQPNGSATYLSGVFPGNNKDIDFSDTLTNGFIAIIPPTGGNDIKNIYIYLLILNFTILGIILAIKAKKSKK